MNIHEYQAKQLLREYGVAVSRGGVAFTVDEAAAQAEELGGPVYVVKSQIHAGGRGAGKFQGNPDGAGGVRVVKSLDEVRESAGEMLGHVLITKQTGPAGKEVNRIYIEDGCDIAREMYLGMLLDRETSRLTMMASTEGGMEIEEVAAATPEKILKVSIDPATGMTSEEARELALGLGLEEGKQVDSGIDFMLTMYKAFIELDASIVEINPLVVTGAGDVIALDAKMNFDDNALYRHQNIEDLRDENEEEQRSASPRHSNSSCLTTT
jgi:succinyl-CoA synthetase beta subunit